MVPGKWGPGQLEPDFREREFEGERWPRGFRQLVRSGTRPASQGVVWKFPYEDGSRSVNNSFTMLNWWEVWARGVWGNLWGDTGLDHGLLVWHTDAQLFPRYMPTLYMPIRFAQYIVFICTNQNVTNIQLLEYPIPLSVRPSQKKPSQKSGVAISWEPRVIW